MLSGERETTAATLSGLGGLGLVEGLERLRGTALGLAVRTAGMITESKRMGSMQLM